VGEVVVTALDPVVETIAAEVHQAWVEAKVAQGVTSRPSADGIEQMVPYEQLPDHLQELDRATVRAVLASPTIRAHMATLDEVRRAVARLDSTVHKD
jgi:hypothetical protein